MMFSISVITPLPVKNGMDNVVGGNNCKGCKEIDQCLLNSRDYYNCSTSILGVMELFCKSQKWYVVNETSSFTAEINSMYFRCDQNILKEEDEEQKNLIFNTFFVRVYYAMGSFFSTARKNISIKGPENKGQEEFINALENLWIISLQSRFPELMDKDGFPKSGLTDKKKDPKEK